MKKDLTQGNITKTMLLFAGPMIVGNLLQQCYNIADTLIVGRCLGPDALAAVGSAYTLMTFLTSIIIGLCMGSGAVFSVYFGKKDILQMKKRMAASFLFIAAVTVFVNILVFVFLDGILRILQVPTEVYQLMRDYIWIIFWGIGFVFLYNYFAYFMRAMQEVVRHSMAACVQQSVMNFGILMIQGLVNSFGALVMAAFAAAVKIDSFAYMPAQEFGNAFSLFISQNHGAEKRDRVGQGMRKAAAVSMAFCLIISAGIFVLAPVLMKIFVDAGETGIIQTGAEYLRIEGAFYCGIGLLFLLYGFYRGVERPEMSLVLTVISLGTRVLLAYLLSPIHEIGVLGIWWAIPIGWILADLVGIICIRRISGYSIFQSH